MSVSACLMSRVSDFGVLSVTSSISQRLTQALRLSIAPPSSLMSLLCGVWICTQVETRREKMTGKRHRKKNVRNMKRHYKEKGDRGKKVEKVRRRDMGE